MKCDICRKDTVYVVGVVIEGTETGNHCMLCLRRLTGSSFREGMYFFVGCVFGWLITFSVYSVL